MTAKTIIYTFLSLVLLQACSIVSANDHGLQTLDSPLFKRVFLIQDKQARKVKAYLVFPTGELRNPYTEGLAHYVEHLAWLSAFGGDNSTRHSNAWTNLYTTGYWLTFEADQAIASINQLLEVTAPFARSKPFMLEERQIIQQEYVSRVTENPLTDIYRAFDQIVFNGSPYTRSVIGQYSDIADFSLADARQLHKHSHQLSQATLLISGDVSARRLKRWLRAAEPPRQRPLSDDQQVSVWPALNPVPELNEASLSNPRLSGDLLLYGSLVPLRDCGTPAVCNIKLQLIRDTIDSTLPGGIANALRFDAFIARNFSFSLAKTGNSHLLISFSAQPDRDISLDTLQETWLNEWQRVISERLPASSLERIRQRISNHLSGVIDEPAFNLELALEQLASNREPYTLVEMTQALDTITIDELDQLLEQLHHSAPRTVIQRIQGLK